MTKPSIKEQVESFITDNKLKDFSDDQETILQDILHAKLNKILVEPILKQYENDYDSLLRYLKEDNWISMFKNKIAKRRTWRVASKVEIFSKRSDAWFPGVVIRIFRDEGGEWLEVAYKQNFTKQIKRFDIDIRCRSSQIGLSILYLFIKGDNNVAFNIFIQQIIRNPHLNQKLMIKKYVI